jgi:hypothetical protein
VFPDVHSFTAAVRDAASVNRLTGLCSQMLDRFGGPAGFAAVWHEAIESARRDIPGSRLAMNSMLAILRLLQACEAM